MTTIDASPRGLSFLSRRAGAVLPAVGFGPRNPHFVAGTPGTLALHGGVPGAAALPRTGLSAAFAAELADPTAPSLRYSVPLGIPELRRWIATEEGGVDPDRVAVTNGALHSLALVFDAILDPGDVVAVGNPTYPLVLTLLRQRRTVITPIAGGVGGLDLDELERRLVAGERFKLLYTIPDLDNPTGESLSAEARQRLVGLAEHYGFLVVSDNPYRWLRFDGVQPADLDLGSDHVIRVNTFSKTLGPGLRLGWIAGPEWLLPAILDARRDSDQHTSLVVQRSVLRFLDTPDAFAESLRRTRSVLRTRHDALLAATAAELGDAVEVPPVAGGIFLWGRLAADLDAAAVLDAAQRHGVDFPLGRYFSSAGDHEFQRQIRWGFSDLTPDDLTEAVHRVARAVAEVRS